MRKPNTSTLSFKDELIRCTKKIEEISKAITQEKKMLLLLMELIRKEKERNTRLRLLVGDARNFSESFKAKYFWFGDSYEPLKGKPLQVGIDLCKQIKFEIDASEVELSKLQSNQTELERGLRVMAMRAGFNTTFEVHDFWFCDDDHNQYTIKELFEVTEVVNFDDLVDYLSFYAVEYTTTSSDGLLLRTQKVYLLDKSLNLHQMSPRTSKWEPVDDEKMKLKGNNHKPIHKGSISRTAALIRAFKAKFNFEKQKFLSEQ